VRDRRNPAFFLSTYIHDIAWPSKSGGRLHCSKALKNSIYIYNFAL
jgi:hypothetical protein